MRCTNWTAIKTTKTRDVVIFICSADKSLEEAKSFLEFAASHTKYPFGNFRRCGGNIQAKITAEDELMFGGTYADLAVHFVCDRCRTEVVDKRLPDKYTLDKWITEL